MTPCQLEVLIHCHVCPFPHPRREAQSVSEAFDFFLDGDIIVHVEASEPTFYTTTDKGKAWLAVILDTPCPTQQWLDEQGRPVTT